MATPRFGKFHFALASRFADRSAHAPAHFLAEHKDSLADVQTAINTGKAVLVDVREAAEWDDGHLRDAKHVSLSELKSGVPPEKLKHLIAQNRIVYLHCAAGGRCLRAADILKAAGYDARPLRPGYEALLKAGFAEAK